MLSWVHICNVTAYRGHAILTSRELMWCYACSWDVRGDLTLNSMVQIHTSVTLLTSRDLACSSGWLTCQHASQIPAVAQIALTCWDRGFESHRRHGYLSVVRVVCCQVEVSATSWSLVQRSPTDCAASLCDLETSRIGAPCIYDISSLRVKTTVTRNTTDIAKIQHHLWVRK